MKGALVFLSYVGFIILIVAGVNTAIDLMNTPDSFVVGLGFVLLAMVGYVVYRTIYRIVVKITSTEWE